MSRRGLLPGVLALLVAAPLAALDEQDDGWLLLLPDEPIPLEELPARPRPLVELGEPFLGTGPLGGGFALPTGAVWRPEFLLWGQIRSALGGVSDPGSHDRGEWANRLDLFGQLGLTQTERFVVSFRPLDDAGSFTGYTFAPDEDSGMHDAANMTVRTAYFEGDFGELFPRLDGADSRPLDLGLAVGRMPVSFQDGMLIDDHVDSFGLVRNTLRPWGLSNLRLTAMLGWGDLDSEWTDSNGSGNWLAGLFSEADLSWTTLAVDAAWVRDGSSGDDGLVAGIGLSQRHGERWNSTFRALGSAPFDGETERLGRGTLLFAELGFTPRGGEDLYYLSGFAAFGRYSSAARDPELGGVLARTGIAYEAPGLGHYGSPLKADAEDALGFSFGHQRYFNHRRTQLVVELGLRDDDEQTAAALAARFQQALGRRFVLRFDGSWRVSDVYKPGFGGRTELLFRF